MAGVDEQRGLEELIASARARRPDAIVFILPRNDGQYSNHATDTLTLLEEAGVAVDYATDPMSTGVHGEKSADIVLPPLLVLFGDAATLASAIDGVVHVVRWFTGKVPRRTIALEVLVQQDAGGSSRRRVKINGATAEEAERLLRQAAKVKPPG
jgi:hypothetical protein